MNVLLLIVVLSTFMTATWDVIWKVVPESVVNKLPTWVKPTVIAVLNLIFGCVFVFTSPSESPIDIVAGFDITSTLPTQILTALMFVGGPEAIKGVAKSIQELIYNKNK